MQQFNKKFDPEVPVYHDRFKTAMDKIKEVLIGYQHDLSIQQDWSNGAVTGLKVTITLRK